MNYSFLRQQKLLFPLLTAALLSVLIFPGIGLSQKELIIVTDEWAPYVYKEENGEIKGSDYEVMKVIFSQLGIKINFQILPWKRCVYLVEKQQADAILDISLNEKRKKTMLFPKEHLSDSHSVLFHLKGKKFHYTKLQDLKGLRVGTLIGYEYNKDFLAANHFIKEPVKSEKQNIEKLLLGRIDLFLSNKNVGLFNAKKAGILDKIAYIQKPVSGGYNYLAFSKKKGHALLVEQFSEKLQLFKQTRAYHEILMKYGRI